MKKIFSFLAIFLISLLSIFGSYNFRISNFEIKNNETKLVNESEKDVPYPTIDSYIEKGDSATLEGWNVDTNTFKVSIKFNDFEVKEDKIYYYLTIDVTSLKYNDLVGNICKYDAKDNSLIDENEMFGGAVIGINETKSTDITIKAPLKTQIKIKFLFGPQSNTRLFVYTSTSAHLMIDNDLKPIITSFGIDESKTTTNSLSWNINNLYDPYVTINSIEIWDNQKDIMLEQLNSTMLVANDYVIDELNSNTTYNFELRVGWSENISVNGQTDEVRQSISVNNKCSNTNNWGIFIGRNNI